MQPLTLRFLSNVMSLTTTAITINK